MRETIRKRRRVRPDRGANTPKRNVDYHNLKSPFPIMKAFSDDRIAAIHEASLKVLENLGIKVLLPEARDLLKQAGARVDDQMVFIGREIIEATLKTPPRSINLRAGTAERDLTLELGRLVFQPGGAAPHATDLVRGRRPGTGEDYRELVQITQHFDALQMLSALVEPQDVDLNLRHYFTTEAQLTLSDKAPFIYARGTPQVMDCFEMLHNFRGVSEEEFITDPFCYTIINTNSPRMIDIPMARGLIDFARHGQMAIVTPFTLMGAMAPITVAGAMTLSHAEALAAIAVNQLANPGAPVLYGTFTSNVDMKSGSPAFGTPEHFTASLAAGQLARYINMPWRNASGAPGAVADAQAANETQFGMWGNLLSGATVVIHAAGWIEGGLSVSYEKLITDVEVIQMAAELCTPTSAADAELAMEAIAEIDPGGHFFGVDHTMERYQTQFYDPIVADWSNYGQWEESGRLTATERATGVWQNILADAKPPDTDTEKTEALRTFIEKRTAEGGALPES